MLLLKAAVCRYPTEYSECAKILTLLSPHSKARSKAMHGGAPSTRASGSTRKWSLLGEVIWGGNNPRILQILRDQKIFALPPTGSKSSIRRPCWQPPASRSMTSINDPKLNLSDRSGRALQQTRKRATFTWMLDAGGKLTFQSGCLCRCRRWQRKASVREIYTLSQSDSPPTPCRGAEGQIAWSGNIKRPTITSEFQYGTAPVRGDHDYQCAELARARQCVEFNRR